MVAVAVNWRTTGDGLKAATASLNHQAVTGWKADWKAGDAAQQQITYLAYTRP